MTVSSATTDIAAFTDPWPKSHLLNQKSDVEGSASITGPHSSIAFQSAGFTGPASKTSAPLASPTLMAYNGGSNTRSPIGSVSSPNLAASQIFERSVGGDPTTVLLPLGGVPAHHLSEDLIPPALDASAETLTDASVDPDFVEVVTVGNLNQQQQVSNFSSTSSSPQPQILASAVLPSKAVSNTDDVEPGCAVFDQTQKRLSFVSYADLIQVESTSAQFPLPPPASSLSSPGSQSPPLLLQQQQHKVFDAHRTAGIPLASTKTPPLPSTSSPSFLSDLHRSSSEMVGEIKQSLSDTMHPPPLPAHMDS